VSSLEITNSAKSNLFRCSPSTISHVASSTVLRLPFSARNVLHGLSTRAWKSTIRRIFVPVSGIPMIAAGGLLCSSCQAGPTWRECVSELNPKYIRGSCSLVLIVRSTCLLSRSCLSVTRAPLKSCAHRAGWLGWTGGNNIPDIAWRWVRG
jgi:hypothetical protein